MVESRLAHAVLASCNVHYIRGFASERDMQLCLLACPSGHCGIALKGALLFFSNLAFLGNEAVIPKDRSAHSCGCEACEVLLARNL
jgi:hypothetical protein